MLLQISFEDTMKKKKPSLVVMATSSSSTSDIRLREKKNNWMTGLFSWLILGFLTRVQLFIMSIVIFLKSLFLPGPNHARND